jgi:hypothetical protein
VSELTGVAFEDQTLFEFLVRLSLRGGRLFEPRTDFLYGELAPRQLGAVKEESQIS